MGPLQLAARLLQRAVQHVLEHVRVRAVAEVVDEPGHLGAAVVGQRREPPF